MLDLMYKIARKTDIIPQGQLSCGGKRDFRLLKIPLEGLKRIPERYSGQHFDYRASTSRRTAL
jgi:hypothetical protein